MAKTPAYRLGIDLGGSKILAAVFNADGEVIGQKKLRTNPEDGYQAVLERLREAAKKACDDADCRLKKEIKSLGVGMPGPVLASQGVIAGAVNLGWGRKPVGKDLSKLFDGLPVAIGNDVNFGALGEASMGSAAGAKSMFALFMGTGLGGAFVRKGKVLDGAHGFAGEIGHLPGPFPPVQCKCGQIGCLETVASKVGIAATLRQAIADGKPCALNPDGKLKASAMRRAWDDGCPSTRAALIAAAKGLAWSVSAASVMVDPQVVVFGGGVMEELGRDLLPHIKDALGNYSFLSGRVEPRLVVASLGDDAVTAGAAVASEGVL